MSDWVDVAAQAEFAAGTYHTLDVDGVQVAVFNLDGAFYAIEDICPHDYNCLTGGEIDGDVVVCPRHGARFSIKTGEVLAPPAYEGVPTFPVRLDNGKVQVRDARWD